jgi:hypothetical protein
MSARRTKKKRPRLVRYESLDDMPPAQRLLSKAFREMSDAEAERRNPSRL